MSKNTPAPTPVRALSEVEGRLTDAAAFPSTSLRAGDSAAFDSAQATATATATATDEHAGQGGAYVVGPDGNRTLVERTAPAVPRSATVKESLTAVAHDSQPAPEA